MKWNAAGPLAALRRLRNKLGAVLGTSVVGSVIGVLFGSSLMAVGAIAGEVSVGLFLSAAALSAGVGAFIGGGFATLLALSGERTLEQLGLFRAATCGLLAGAVFPLVAAIVTGGWLVPFDLTQLALLGATFGLLGGGMSAGLVAVAKGADDPELSSGEPAADRLLT